jgi:hypothetical protein
MDASGVFERFVARKMEKVNCQGQEIYKNTTFL